VFNIRRALSIGLITSALLATSLMQATPALAASTSGYGWNVECRDVFGQVTSNPGDVLEAVCLSVHVYAKTATGLKVDIIQVKHYAPNGWCYQGTQNELLKNGVVYRAQTPRGSWCSQEDVTIVKAQWGFSNANFGFGTKFEGVVVGASSSARPRMFIVNF
jgi:hypothetical protein